MSLDRHQPHSSDSFTSIGSYEHVLFLGTFNADPFQKQIEKWLPALDLTNVALFVGDNHSTDNTPNWMSALIAKLDCASVVSINEKNYGGYGNLASNLQKFGDAKWITTLHQDDEYSPDHVQNHRRVIRGASSSLGMICSESSSVAPNGRGLGFPRAHWLLENKRDPVTVFLGHLRNHAYPFSGATFSKDVLKQFPIPWHSTAFPDTEIVMKMAVDYQVAFAKGVTVKYLENPGSESHSLSEQHRDFGAFQALVRVFAHPNYEKLCGLIAERDVPDFLNSLDEGISQRFQDAAYAELLKQIAFELTAQHIGTGPELASYLAEGYIRIGDVRALSTLSSLGARIPGEVATKQQSSSDVTAVTQAPSRLGRLALLSAYLPRWILRMLFKAFMKSDFGRKRLPSWDFKWRDG